MAISSEFAQAVRDKNMLRVKIMLKDSLLVDKTFRLFNEMQAYASDQGASPWTDVDISLKKAEKPWSEDTINYELTALVNDFTKEHVNYVMTIISDVYQTNSSVSKQRSVSRSTHNATPHLAYRTSIGGTVDPYRTILSNASGISRILRDNKGERTRTRKWKNEDIERIRKHAQKIVDACNSI